MISGRLLRSVFALLFSSWFLLGCSVSEQLQGFLGSVNNQNKIYFATPSTSAEEVDGSKDIVINLDKASEVEVIFTLALSGTATDTNDYMLSATTVTLSPGQTSFTVTVNLVNDATAESDESVILTLSAPVGAGLGLPSAHVLTIGFSDVPAFTWVGKAGDGLWTSASNWSTGVIPGASDIAIFDNICVGVDCNATVNTDINISGLDIKSSYTGTITQGSGSDIVTGAGHFSLAGGTLVGASNAKIDVNGAASSFLMSGGTLTMNGGDLEVTGTTFTYSGGTANWNSSKVIFNGTGLMLNNAVAGAFVLPNTEMRVSGLVVLMSTGYILVQGNLLLDEGTGTNGWIIGNWMAVDGSITATNWKGSSAAAIYVLAGDSVALQSTAATGVMPYIIADPGGTVSFSGAVNLGEGLEVPSTASLVTNNFEATIVCGLALTCSYDLDLPNKFYDLRIKAPLGGDTITFTSGTSVERDLVIENTTTGATLNNGPIEVGRNVNFLSHKSGSLIVKLVGGAAQSVSAAVGTALPSVVIDKSAGVVSQSSNINFSTAGQDFNIVSGTWDMAGYSLTINDRLDMSAGTHLYKGCGTLTHPSTGTISGTIHNGKDVTIDVADASVIEGGALNFVVTSTPANCQESTFTYISSDNSATTADSDYTPVNATATMGIGVASITLSVATGNDGVAELNEELILTLSAFSDAGDAGDVAAKGTILDNDGGATNNITVSSLTFSGITNDDLNAQILFSGDDNANANVVLYWCNVTDYTGCDPTVANGASQGSLTMTRGSGVYTGNLTNLPYPTEGGETLNVRVVVSDTEGVTGSPLNSTVTLLPVVWVSEVSAVEGQALKFVAKLNKVSAQEVTVQYGTATNTALTGVDYTSTSNFLTIPAGSLTSPTISISTVEDGLAESTENFWFMSLVATNAVIGNTISYGRIVDNDPGPVWPQGLNGAVEDIVVDSSTGKQYVGGRFTGWDSTLNKRIASINSDGSENLGFYIGQGSSDTLNVSALQPDGKMLFSGYLTEFDGVPTGGIVRLHADGSVDTSFDIGTGFSSGYIEALAVQSDGKIIVGGQITSYNGNTIYNITRINSDGSWDSSFVPNVNGLVNSFVIASNGQIVIAGNFTTVNSITQNRVARLNIDGTLDTSFNSGTALNSSAKSITRQSDGKLIVAGSFTQYNGASSNGVVRLNGDGTIDSSFSVGSGAGGGMIYTTYTNATDKIFIGGAFTSFNAVPANGIVKLNVDGSIDTTFVSSLLASATVRSIIENADSTMYLAGALFPYAGSSRINIVRFNADGSADTSFDVGNGANSEVRSLLKHSNGTLVASGAFISFAASGNKGLTRFNVDGSRDTTFSIGSGFYGGSYEHVYALELQADGKIIAGGGFESFNGATVNRLARLNTDGSLDTTFVTGTSVDNSVHDIKYLTDGKILVAGSFTTYNGNSSRGIVRLNSDGALDTSFIVGSGFQSASSVTVQDMAIQSDNKIVVAGYFQTYNGFSQMNLTRLNADGTRDTGFSTGGSGPNSFVNALALQEDGKIVVVGDFWNFNGVDQKRIVRLNTDGSKDNSFNIGTGCSGCSVASVQVQADGKVLVSGLIGFINGISVNGIARLNTNGSVDTTFPDPESFGINVLRLLPDQTLYTGGVYTSLYNAFAPYYAKILPPNDISVGNLSVSNITSASFSASVGFHGDADSDSTVTLWYCNHTDSPGCDPTTGTSVVMARGSGVSAGKYIGTVTGLSAPHDPTDTLNIRVVASDPDGASGSPLNSTVTLAASTTISIANGAVTEGNAVKLVVSLTAPVTWPVVFDWAAADATAKQLGADPDDDYTASSGVATIPAGQTSITLPGVQTKDDSFAENVEYFTIGISNIIDAIPGTVTGLVTMSETDYAPSISIRSLSVLEGQPAAFVVSLSKTSTLQTVFNYATSDGTAKQLGSDPDNDYTISSGTMTIAAGQTSITLPNIATLDDASVESSEYFTVTLSSILNHSSVSSVYVATASIMDNDAAANNAITISNFKILEVTSNSFKVSVDYEGDTNNNSFLLMYFCDETIKPGCNPEADGPSTNTIRSNGTYVWSITPATLTYPYFAGNSLKIRVKVVSDTDGISGSPIDSTLQLLPVLDLQEQASLEGQNLNFVVTLNQPALQDVTFTWSTSSGTAISGSSNDYNPSGGAITIPSGQTSATLPAISTFDDTQSETTELFYVTLASPLGASIRTATAPGRILDNDPGIPLHSGFNNQVEAIVSMPDAKRIVGGSFSAWDENLNSAGVMVKPDGSENLAFRLGVGFNNRVHDWLVQPDGKVIAYGMFSSVSGSNLSRIARFHSDGTLDTGFVIGSGFNADISKIDIQSDNKLLVVGSFTNYNGSAVSYIVRLNPDGSLDTSFAASPGPDGAVTSVKVSPDGKIYIIGGFVNYNGVPRARLARLLHNGNLDASFDPGTSAVSINDLELFSDGKLLIVGDFTSYNGTARVRIAKINKDGTLDLAFDSGTGADQMVRKSAILSDGKILIGGYFYNYAGTARNKLARINADGSLDTTFVPNLAGSQVFDIVIPSSGDYLVAGSFTTYDGVNRNNIAKIKTDGTLDTAFNPGFATNYYINGIFLLKNDHVLLGGDFTSYGGLARAGLARMDASGVIDTAFVASSIVAGVKALIVQPDGKILIGGSSPGLARINSDGTSDTSFNVGTGTNFDAVYSMALQPDGKIVIGGTFNNFNGVGRTKFARVNSDGSLDTGFVVGASFNSIVNGVKIQSDGKIVVTGFFSSYQGVGRIRIARINPDASLDTTFDTSTAFSGFGFPYSLAIMPNDQILVGGTITDYKGTAVSGLVRINNDASFDTTFNMGSGPGPGGSASVTAFETQGDGKILIGGGFTSYNGNAAGGIARLLSDGTFDTSFNVGSGFSAGPSAISVGPDSQIFTGGIFSSYDGQVARRFKVIGAPDSISVGVIQTSNITQTSFKATVGYHGDYDEDATFTLKWCNQTDNAGCTPANDTPMTWVSGQTKFEVTISGLSAPNDPGDTLKIEVVVNDPDGTEGAPLTSTVQLAP